MKTLKAKAIDFVASKGKATWSEIHSFILNETNSEPISIRPNNRGSYASYFSGHSPYYLGRNTPKGERNSNTHGLLLRRGNTDLRYLKKEGKFYTVTEGPYQS